jgi:hypothetical protein
MPPSFPYRQPKSFCLAITLLGILIHNYFQQGELFQPAPSIADHLMIIPLNRKDTFI